MQGEEPVQVQTLIPEGPIEALYEAILDRLARLNVVNPDVPGVGPGIESADRCSASPRRSPCVLVLELLEPARFGDIHAAVILLPAIERICADAVAPAQLARLSTGIRLRQDGDDLLFRKPAILHDSSRLKESHYNWIRFRGSAQSVQGVAAPLLNTA